MVLIRELVLMNHRRTPDVMPILSPGKHRNARKGACFMEMASYLAGERWSDHPHCTHRLLAGLARDINDHVGDDARQHLVPLIPLVIGVVGDDPRIDAKIALEATLTALPLVSAARQRVAAVGALRCEAALAELDGLPAEHMSARTRLALRQVPDAERWARDFSKVGWGSKASFAHRSAPTIVHNAVAGISAAAVPDPDVVLVDLLTRMIDLCREWMLPAPTETGQIQPRRERTV
ncbi:MAG TPA: hypothetical protein VLB03_11970 [Nocardioidaceae bacterium]|nr:hypothetical protein [Nocardioidaceae bacterium]